MDPESVIQSLGIRIANDAIAIAQRDAQITALNAEIGRLQAAVSEVGED